MRQYVRGSPKFLGYIHQMVTSCDNYFIKAVTICNNAVASHRLSFPEKSYKLFTLNIIVQYEFIKATSIILLVNNCWHLNLPMLDKTKSNEWK